MSNEKIRLCVAKGEAARMLSVSVRTIERLIAAGDLAAVKVASATRILTESIYAYVSRANTAR